MMFDWLDRSMYAAALLAAGAAALRLSPVRLSSISRKGVEAVSFPFPEGTAWEATAEEVDWFNSWPNAQRIPDEIRVWCNGFIPDRATSQIIGDKPVIPIELPTGLPVPGLVGQCAVIDGRDWSDAPPDTDAISEAPDTDSLQSRPADSRFRAWLSVGQRVRSGANCGYSHSLCCSKKGCSGGIRYGEPTCEDLHCPDSQMQVDDKQCWSSAAVAKNGSWTRKGVSCSHHNNSLAELMAVSAYFRGRASNPCTEPFGVPSPSADWDIGVLVLPSKRLVYLTGSIKAAPSTECYAQAKDGGEWGAVVPLARLPSTPGNYALLLTVYGRRRINPEEDPRSV